MTRLAVETRLGSLSTYTMPAGPYDSTKLGLSSVIKQFTGTNPEDKFAGPLPIGLARPIEGSGAVPALYPWAMQWSPTIDWVFFSDGQATSATRRVQMYTYDRTATTNQFGWVGSITLNLPFLTTQGTYVASGFRMIYDKYTTGTASVSGTAVTGNTGPTTWQASRLAVGGRIGFGSSDPTLITNWYNITAITNDASITIDANIGTVVDGPYVIEELRAVHLLVNGTTATNGGVFLTKGLNPSTFTSGSQAIIAAVSTDNIRATYWLKDAASETNTAGIGCDYMPRASWTTHHLYALNTVANPIMYKYNLRAALTVASGSSTDALVLISGAGGAVGGTMSQTNNGRIATLAHGNGSGVACMYFATTTKIYRTSDVTAIAAASTSWLPDSLSELAPGAAATYAASATLKQVEYLADIDKLLVPTAVKAYVTRYLTDGSQFDRICLTNTLQINQSTAEISALAYFPCALAVFNVFYVAGLTYLAGVGTTAATNMIYAVPLSADWEYTTTSSHRLIFPAMTTTGCSSFGSAYMNVIEVLGGKTGKNLGMAPDSARLSYRISGITDNTGAWTPLDGSGDMSTVAASNSVQFCAEFKTISTTGIPGRITAMAVTYNDASTDTHFQPSVANSDITNKRFAWRFATAFTTTVPRLRIRLYNAVTGEGPLVDDDSTTRVGTWEKSTNGGTSWVNPWTNEDKGNDITYLRFTPLSLGDNIRVRAMLSLY